MGAPKKTYERRKIHIDGWLRADDDLLKVLESLPRGQRFKTVARWLKMGRVVEAMKPGVNDEELRRQVEAAREIAESFVMEDF